LFQTYEFLSSDEHKGRYFKGCWLPLTSIVGKTITVNHFDDQHSSKYHLSCSAEETHSGLEQHEGEYMMTELLFLQRIQFLGELFL